MRRMYQDQMNERHQFSYPPLVRLGAYRIKAQGFYQSGYSCQLDGKIFGKQFWRSGPRANQSVYWQNQK